MPLLEAKVNMFLTFKKRSFFYTITIVASLIYQTVAETDHPLQLTKCCGEKEFYTIGFGRCQSAGKSSLNSDQLQSIPPIHSVSDDNLIVMDDHHLHHLHISQNLTTCEEGYVPKSSFDFKFFQDGSLKVNDIEGSMNPGTFCIHQSNINNHQLAAIFCVPDPCRNTFCVRKCCPNGMIMNHTGNVCHSDERFSLKDDVRFHNEKGFSVTVDPEHFTVREDAAPRCSHGIILHNPSEGDLFYILPDSGRMYAPSYIDPNDRVIEEYCIEVFSSHDGDHMIQALSCFPDPATLSNDGHELVLLIYPYFLLISSFFLIVTFVVYALLPELQNIHGLTVMCYVASMAVLYVGLGTIMLYTDMENFLCVGLAVIVHFAFLATFTWMNVMSYDIWKTFSPSRAAKPRAVSFWMKTVSDGTKENSDAFPQTLDSSNDESETDTIDERGNVLSNGRKKMNRTFLWYSFYGWGAPFVIVFVGQLLDNIGKLPDYIVVPEFGRRKCWFDGPKSILVYLYGPVAIPILSNICFFVMTAMSLCRKENNSSASRYHARQKFFSLFAIFILMGILWITEIISYFVGGSLYIWIPMDLLNILTGIFVFFLFTCRPNVWKLLKVKFPSLQRLDRCCPACMNPPPSEEAQQNNQTPTTTTATVEKIEETSAI